MPRKKEEYSTLDQIVNALLKKEKLDDSKYQKLQNSIKIIIAANVDDVVRDYLNRCLAIKQDIGNLLALINEANTSDAIKKLCEKVGLIGREIEGIDINQIKLGIETKKVKTQINSIKEDFQSNIEKFREKLKQKENELEEENKMVQTQKELSSTSSNEASSDQSRAEGAGAVPKRRKKRDEKRYEQYVQEEKKGQCEKREEQDAQQESKNIQIKSKNYYLSTFDTSYKEIVNNAYKEIVLGIYEHIYALKKHKLEGISKRKSKVFDLKVSGYIAIYSFSRVVKNIMNKITSEKVLQDQHKRLLYMDYNSLIQIIKTLDNKIEKKVKEKVDNIESKFSAIMSNLSTATGISISLNMSNDNINSIKDYFIKNISSITFKVENKDVEIVDPIDIFNSSCTIEEVLQKLKQHQPSPNSDIEEASLQDGACAHRR